MRWLTIAAAVAALALGLLAAGCGGGDDEASDEPDTTLTDTETTDETTTDDTTTDETDTDTDIDTDLGENFDFGDEDCQDLLNASAALSAAFGAAGTGDDLSEETDAFQEFAEQVPDEIEDDVRILADAFASYADALGDLDLQAGETPTPEQALELSQALSSIDQPNVTAASERLSTWAQENCTG